MNGVQYTADKDDHENAASFGHIKIDALPDTVDCRPKVSSYCSLAIKKNSVNFSRCTNIQKVVYR